MFDERRQRVSGLFERYVHLRVQQRLQRVQRRLRQRTNGQQQLRLVRPRLHEQPGLRKRDLHVQLVGLPELLRAVDQVLQEQHDLRVRVPRAALQLRELSALG
jgi:hypothetical protein